MVHVVCGFLGWSGIVGVRVLKAFNTAPIGPLRLSHLFQTFLRFYGVFLITLHIVMWGTLPYYTTLWLIIVSGYLSTYSVPTWNHQMAPLPLSLWPPTPATPLIIDSAKLRMEIGDGGSATVTVGSEYNTPQFRFRVLRWWLLRRGYYRWINIEFLTWWLIRWIKGSTRIKESCTHRPAGRLTVWKTLPVGNKKDEMLVLNPKKNYTVVIHHRH